MLPHINPSDASLPWTPPCKRIYGSKEVAYFRESVAIDRIQATLYLICSKVSLTDVPAGVLDDRRVDFENATHPGVAIARQNAAKDRQRTHFPSPLNLPPPESPKFSVESLSKPVASILNLLDELQSTLDSTPPFQGPRRYGNMACRDWHDKVTKSVNTWLIRYLWQERPERKDEGKPESRDNTSHDKNSSPQDDVLPSQDDVLPSQDDVLPPQDDTLPPQDDTLPPFLIETRYYFLGSFGSRERLDFGTGHELSFLAFLSCLIMCDILPRDETTGTDYLIIFSRYYDFVRALIQTYTLEPAGSHGVWGLDDHFHLIYILGACQMVDFSRLESGEKSMEALNYRMGLTPSSVLNPNVLRRNRTRNLFYNAVAFIHRVKFGPFNEHSPLLYEISTSKSWEKIAQGMLKMYYGEVLSKFPVVQHFYFGHVMFPWIERGTLQELPESYPEEEEINGEEQGVNFRSEGEIAMDSLYRRRENELTRLSEKAGKGQGEVSSHEPTERAN